MNLKRGQRRVELLGAAQDREAFLQVVQGLRGGLAARKLGEHALKVGHGFFRLLQVGVGHAALLQGLRHQRAVGPVVEQAREARGGRLVLAGLKRKLRLLKHGLLGVARGRVGFEQRGQRGVGLVAAAHQAQGAALLEVGVVLVGGVGRYHLVVEREGLRVAFGHVIGVGQAQGGIVVVGVGGLRVGIAQKSLKLGPGALVLLGVVVGVPQPVAGFLLKIGFLGAHAALPGRTSRRHVGRDGLGVLLAHAVNLAPQHLRGGPQAVVGRELQRLIQQRQSGRIVAVVIEDGGLRVGHPLVGGVQLVATVIEPFEVSQRLRVISR